MYAQYQNFRHQNGGMAVSTQQPAVSWNGSQWQQSADPVGASNYSTFNSLSTHHKPTTAPATTSIESGTDNVKQYTNYYHQWTSRAQEQERYAQSLPLHSQERAEAQRQADWAKYYADQSSRAAHHFHKNPSTAPSFELPPAPSTASATQSQSQDNATNVATNVGLSQPSRGRTSYEIPQQQQQQQPQPSATAGHPAAPPDGLKRFVHRCLQHCTTDEQRKLVQQKTEAIIAATLQKGSLHSTNWDEIPVPSDLLGSVQQSNQNSQPNHNSQQHHGSNGSLYPQAEHLQSRKKQKLESNSSYYGPSGTGGSSWISKNQNDHPAAKTSMRYQKAPNRKGLSMSESVYRQQLPQNDSYYGNVDSHSVTSSDSIKNSDFIAFSKGKKNKNKKKQNGNKNDGFSRTASTLNKRANRFSGRGGGTLSATTKPDSDYAIADRYMGKGLIGGSHKKLDDSDYEKMTVKGTCQVLEKNYLRLTAPPKADLVRPLEILKKHVENLKMERGRADRRDYNWFCSQFKAVRQDCTVQRIQSAFTVDVYETHARIALEEGDLNEYNQCQTQLIQLYDLLKDDKEAMRNSCEFLAYRLIYYVFLTGNKKYDGGSSDLFKIMLSLTPEQREDPAVKHALQVRASVADVDYHRFFRLQGKCPNLGGYLMEFLIPNMRHWALQRICKAYRPTAEIKFVLKELGFETETEGHLKDGKAYLESCGCIVHENGLELLTKDSTLRESDLQEKKSLI